jgi:predicted nucleic acid-binding protein
VILVDSSVWIDYFRGIQSSQTDRLHALLGNEPIATGDLVLAEVLQGFGSAQDFNQGKKLLTSLPIIELVGGDIAIQAASNFRTLRSLGRRMGQGSRLSPWVLANLTGGRNRIRFSQPSADCPWCVVVYS